MSERKGKKVISAETEKMEMEIERLKLEIELAKLKVSLTSSSNESESPSSSSSVKKMARGKGKAPIQRRNTVAKSEPKASSSSSSSRTKRFSERDRFVEERFEQLVQELKERELFLRPAVLHKILGLEWRALHEDGQKEGHQKLFPLFDHLTDLWSTEKDSGKKREGLRVALNSWFELANQLLPPTEKSVFLSEKQRELRTELPDAKLGEIHHLALKAWSEHVKLQPSQSKTKSSQEKTQSWAEMDLQKKCPSESSLPEYHD